MSLGEMRVKHCRERGDARGLLKLVHHKDRKVSVLAASSLAGLKTDAALDALIEGLSADDEHVRALCARRLVSLRSLRTVPHLLRLLGDASGSVRSGAADALRAIELDEASVELLIEALSERDDRKGHLLSVLGTTRSPRAMEVLATYLDDEEWGREVTKMMREAGASAASGLLVSLRSETVAVRLSAAKSVSGASASEDVVAALIGALRDPSAEVRDAAAQALGRVGASNAYPALISALEDPEVRVASSAAWALGGVGCADAVPVLIGLLFDGPVEVQRSAAMALGEFDDASAVEPLVAAAKADDDDLREWALQSLASYPGEVPTRALIGAAQRESNRAVRRWAIGELGKREAELAFEPLCKMIEVHDSEYGATAARALGEMGDARAVERLKPWVLGSAMGFDTKRHHAAAEALGRLGARGCGEALEFLASLKDSTSEMQREGARIGLATAVGRDPW